MTFFIEHLNTKRKIAGPFNICGSFNDLRRLRDALTAGLREGAEDELHYGWIDVTALENVANDSFEATLKQKSRAGLPVVGWESD